MKFSCVIFICPLIIASVMAMSLTRTTFDACDPGNWIMTNTTLKWNNSILIITSDVFFYKEMDNGTIYNVHIVTDECKNHTTCTGKPKVSVENVNCTNPNLSESDICKFTAKIKQVVEWIKAQYGLGPLNNVVICVDLENIDFSSSSKSNESK